MPASDPAASVSRDATAAPVVALRSITRRFPGVLANDRVDLALVPGRVHVLLGENGAGKSTLIAILAGLQQPDAGEILVDGRPVAIASPRRALDLGIGTVFQHEMLVPSLSVVENLVLGGGPWWRRCRRGAAAVRYRAIAAPLGILIDPDRLVGDLSLGERQQVEIVRALWRGGRILVLDEPTSMLTPDEIGALGRLLGRLRERGTAILLVTHKLDEAYALGDEVSVLRQGRLVGRIEPEELARLDRDAAVARIVRAMFEETGSGDPAVAAEGGRAARRRPPAPGAPDVLRVEGLSVAGPDGRRVVEGVSFAVRAGEIFGIAGVDGNGQKPLLEAISGQRPASGRVWLDGEEIGGLAVPARHRRGLRYVTDDRLGEGTIAQAPVAEALVLKRIGEAPFWRSGIVRPAAIKAHAAAAIERFDIRVPGPGTPVGRLSGGNIQKVLLARELHGRAKVILYNKPTYGLDLNNIRLTRGRIRDGADAGMAVVVVSTDLDELVSLCDRIGVMSRGRLAGIVDNDDGGGGGARARIGQLMIGMPVR